MPTPAATSDTAAVGPVTKYTVKIDGTAVNNTLPLQGFSVDTSLRLPAMATLVFLEATDPAKGSLADDLLKHLGKSVEISVAPATGGGGPTEEVVFKGQVASMEARGDSGRAVVVLRCADKLRTLYGGRKSRVFLKQTYSDIASKVIQDAGLSAKVTATTVNHPFVLQHQESDGEFLERLAAEIGYVLSCDRKTEAISFAPPPKLTKSPAVPSGGRAGGRQLMYGEDLVAYEASAAPVMISSVKTHGWDPANKQVIVGEKQVDSAYETTATGFGKKKHDKATQTLASPINFLNQPDAMLTAEAIANDIASNRVRFRGRVHGNPFLSAGVEVAIGGAGKTFNGHYLITSCQHAYEDGQLITEFACDGLGDRGLFGGADGGEPVAATPVNPMPCAMTAIVTNLNDPDKLGRVKVKFPTLGQYQGTDIESDWMRVVAPGAGAAMGTSWLPEVNDEVVTILDRGDFRTGYVLGGVHNKQDKPPKDLGTEAFVSGKVEKKGFVTRALSRLLFVDKAGEEAAELHLKDTLITMKFSAKDKQAEIIVDGKEKFTMKSGTGITVESTDGDIVIKGKNVKVEAQANFEVKANSNAKIEGTTGFEAKGATAKVQGQGQAELSSSGQTAVKGSLVMIN